MRETHINDDLNPSPSPALIVLSGAVLFGGVLAARGGACPGVGGRLSTRRGTRRGSLTGGVAAAASAASSSAAAASAAAAASLLFSATPNIK